MNKKKFNTKNIIYIVVAIICCILFKVCYNFQDKSNINTSVNVIDNKVNIQSINQVPEYTGQFIININEGNPNFDEDNLLVTGVQMEAESVEDRGESICYNVFIYNVQEGININYATGESSCK